MKLILAILAVFVFHASSDAAESAKPNIIVIYTDDHGYADLGVQGSVADVRTPNLDALARSGVLARHGYSTAPQCVPSRAGLLVGKFQGRFNLDANGGSLDGFDMETTIAQRLQTAGYVTAQFGKWHLGATEAIPTCGFKHVFSQNAQRPFSANITLDGQDRPMSNLPPEMYHIDGCSRAAASIIERYRNDPFFFYVAFRAPHTPLDAPKSYTDCFPGKMPERRRQALGMLSAIDDGVGLITATLKKHGLTERTLIFFIGDNGAPLKIHKADSPLNGDAGGWDGSLNDPLNGEKGMLAEGWCQNASRYPGLAGSQRHADRERRYPPTYSRARSEWQIAVPCPDATEAGYSRHRESDFENFHQRRCEFRMAHNRAERLPASQPRDVFRHLIGRLADARVANPRHRHHYPPSLPSARRNHAHSGN